MQYLAAYALVELSGHAPSEKEVEAVLKAAGVSVDSSCLEALFAELKGKSFADVMAEGRTKLVGSGSAAPATGSSAAPAGGAAAPAAEAKKDEPEEEGDDDMGFGLFD